MSSPRMPERRDTLPEALRDLAATSPQASADLGARLGEAFARHHARRRMRQRVALAVGLAACVAISIVLLRSSRQTKTAKTVETTVQNTTTPSPAQQTVVPETAKQAETPVVAKAAVKPRVHKEQVNKPRNQTVEPPAVVESEDFVALPSFDPAIPLGESRMVRMDLPGSDLQLIGYPVDGQLLDRRILTDVLVGQDGMPYAVRLVQTRNVH